MTIIGEDIPLISEKQSLSKVLLNDKNNELSDGTNFWDKNRQLTTDEIDCYLQKIAASAKIPSQLSYWSLPPRFQQHLHGNRSQ